MKLAIALCLVSIPAAAEPREPDPVAPAAEVFNGNPVDLPAVPAFTFKSGRDIHTVKELRVHGAKWLDSEITVAGVVTGAYDCVAAVRQPKEPVAKTQHRIDDDPTLCERPKFYLGDAADTPPEKSLWVVDVPRTYNKLEMERMTKADRTAPDRCEPGDTKHHVCPPYKVGDVVTISGDFKLSSPHSERNSDGLLVLHRINNATKKWQTDGSTWATPSAPIEIVQTPVQRPTVPANVKKAPTRRVLANRGEIEKHEREAAKAMGGKQFDTAIAEAQQATKADPEDHLAFYTLGGATAQRGDWKLAAEAFTKAAGLRPDVAMYQMWRGIALYERAVATAREDLAKQQGRKPEEVSPDLSTISFADAIVPLLAAIQLEPKLWRAHYYLGRIDRAANADRAAAEDFTHAIAGNPREAGPYIALAELYRRWDYTDEAIKIATQGTTNIPSPSAVADVWYELGMGWSDKRQWDHAIDAFSKAIELQRDHAQALFQRGEAYLANKQGKLAKADLEAFVKIAPPKLDFAKQQAQQLLLDAKF